MVVKDVVIIEIYLIIVELIFFVKNFKLYGIIYFWFGWMKFVIFY